MTFLQTMIQSIFHQDDASHVSVDARVENAIFDLKQKTRANIATTKLLEETLQRSASN